MTKLNNNIEPFLQHMIKPNTRQEPVKNGNYLYHIHTLLKYILK
jgi:hypothetical protein